MKNDLFHAIADPTRRAILVLVASQAMTPNAVAEHFQSSRQAVSKHIKVLTESNLLSVEKKGRELYYQLNPAQLKELDQWLAPFKALWEERFLQLDHVLQTLKPNQE